MKALDLIRKRMAKQGIDLPADTEFVRSYAGRAMRASGAWSWSLYSPSDRTVTFGSHYPVSVLAKCKDWDIEPLNNWRGPDRSIDPCDDCQKGIGR